jgi:hypothetical protein
MANDTNCRLGNPFLVWKLRSENTGSSGIGQQLSPQAQYWGYHTEYQLIALFLEMFDLQDLRISHHLTYVFGES